LEALGSIALGSLKPTASEAFVPKGNLLAVRAVVEEALEKESFEGEVLQEDVLVAEALVEQVGSWARSL
jgi:hypothetical protein